MCCTIVWVCAYHGSQECGDHGPTFRSQFSPSPMGARDRTWIIRHVHKHLYQLGHLMGPQLRLWGIWKKGSSKASSSFFSLCSPFLLPSFLFLFLTILLMVFLTSSYFEASWFYYLFSHLSKAVCVLHHHWDPLLLLGWWLFHHSTASSFYFIFSGFIFLLHLIF